MADARERLLEATYSCVARWGMAKTRVDDVAREAKMSRATVYRYFPGGRDELFREVVRWEAARFFEELTRAVAPRHDFAELLEEALLFAHKALEEHVVLQRILVTEPDRFLPLLTVENARILGLVKQFLVLAAHRATLRPGVSVDEATDYLSRMLLSYLGSPGQWNLDDRGEVRLLVRTELLAGIAAPGE
ncbi:MAG TPA: TetR/AcrR family transcriptional regulator [Acidimicrobiales bacterium]|nr:TetR/AcrR family transcriptional regulator [Acidimicrobiales bacterium]